MRSARVLTVAAILIGALGLWVPEATAKAKSIKACPTTITEAGSYVLDKSLTAIGTCITILTNDVTIDLSGNTLTGDGGSDGISEGGAARQGISISNGTITNFGNGIALTTSTASEVRKVRVIGNTNNTIKNNTASGNSTFDGIQASSDSTISHNTASDNGRDGIVAGSRNTISNNTTSNNGDDGIDAGTNNTVSHNTAISNGDVGISVFCSADNVSNVIGNTAQQNNAPAPFTNSSVAGCNLVDNSF